MENEFTILFLRVVRELYEMKCSYNAFETSMNQFEKLYIRIKNRVDKKKEEVRSTPDEASLHRRCCMISKLFCSDKLA